MWRIIADKHDHDYDHDIDQDHDMMTMMTNSIGEADHFRFCFCFHKFMKFASASASASASMLLAISGDLNQYNMGIFFFLGLKNMISVVVQYSVISSEKVWIQTGLIQFRPE